MIVSNATPLIAFARIGELVLLERIVERLTLPQAVWQEAEMRYSPRFFESLLEQLGE